MPEYKPKIRKLRDWEIQDLWDFADQADKQISEAKRTSEFGAAISSQNGPNYRDILYNLLRLKRMIEEPGWWDEWEPGDRVGNKILWMIIECTKKRGQVDKGIEYCRELIGGVNEEGNSTDKQYADLAREALKYLLERKETWKLGKYPLRLGVEGHRFRLSLGLIENRDPHLDEERAKKMMIDTLKERLGIYYGASIKNWPKKISIKMDGRTVKFATDFEINPDEINTELTQMPDQFLEGEYELIVFYKTRDGKEAIFTELLHPLYKEDIGEDIEEIRQKLVKKSRSKISLRGLHNFGLKFDENEDGTRFKNPWGSKSANVEFRVVHSENPEIAFKSSIPNGFKR